MSSLHNKASTTHTSVKTVTESILLSLPDRALRRIIFYMCDLDSATPRGIQEAHKRKAPCRHTFIRSAFDLARTCKRLYSLYREMMTKPDYFCRGYLISSSCEPSVCLTPLMNKVRSLKVVCYNPFVWEYHCVVDMEETNYFLENKNNCSPSSFSKKARYRMERNHFVLRSHEFNIFFQVIIQNPLTNFELHECSWTLPSQFWSTMANSWSNTIISVGIHESLLFDQRFLSQIARMQNLQSISVHCYPVSCIDPLANLTWLKQLSVRTCSLTDEAFEPVLRCLRHLEILDISDTLISPRISQSLPQSLKSIEAGEQAFYQHGDTNGADGKKCQCIRFTHAENAHLAGCEQINPGPFNPRWATMNISFLFIEALPCLTAVSWGHWIQHAQGIASLAGVIPSLQSLSLYGRDFNDEAISILPFATKLKVLRFYGCSITDCSAREIGARDTLEYVTIVNCQGITDTGLMEIADGSAARLNNLKAITLDESRSLVKTPNELKTELNLRMVARQLHNYSPSNEVTTSSISQSSPEE